jgi:hypothetical protein
MVLAKDRYAHFSDSTHRQAMESLDRAAAPPKPIQVNASPEVH